MTHLFRLDFARLLTVILIHVLPLSARSSTELFSGCTELSLCLLSNAFLMGFLSTDDFLKAVFVCVCASFR